MILMDNIHIINGLFLLPSPVMAILWLLVITEVMEMEVGLGMSRLIPILVILG